MYGQSKISGLCGDVVFKGGIYVYREKQSVYTYVLFYYICISLKHHQKVKVFITSLILVIAPELYMQLVAMLLQMTERQPARDLAHRLQQSDRKRSD